MATLHILMPKLGHLEEVSSVVEWRKQPGEMITAGEVFIVIETGKASVEVEATFNGRLARILVDAGVPVPVHTPIAEYETTGHPPSAQEDAAACR